MRLSDEALRALAPTSLPNYRQSRYRAEEQALELAAFREPDQQIVVSLYGFLRELMALTAEESQTSDSEPTEAVAPLRSLDRLLERNDFAFLVGALQRLGRDQLKASQIAQATHEVRGGALSALTLALGSRSPRRSLRETYRLLFGLARDHAKVMRNVVADLDPDARHADLALVTHRSDELSRAIRDFPIELDGKNVTVDVESKADVVIAESCVEYAAVDRIVYNLLNNAARYASTATVQVSMFPIHTSLRIVVANTVSDEQRARLHEEFVEGSLPLDYTSTSSGLGRRMVAELVGNAYGIAEIDEVVEHGYCGSKLMQSTFVAWFHWPLGRPA